MCRVSVVGEYTQCVERCSANLCVRTCVQEAPSSCPPHGGTCADAPDGERVSTVYVVDGVASLISPEHTHCNSFNGC